MDSENYNNRLTSQELFKVKLALSCLSNRVTVCPVQAKLYLLKGESWKLHKTGVAAVVLNTGESGERNPKGVKLSLVELESGFPSWNEELSDSSQYKAQDNKFHTLVLNNNNGAGNMAGLQFEEEGAASLFLKEIVDSIDELKSSNNTNELSKLEISSRKEKIKKFRKLRKSEISTPCLFTHVTNISSTQADTLDEPSTSDSNSDRRDSRSGSTSGKKTDKVKRSRSFSMSKKK